MPTARTLRIVLLVVACALASTLVTSAGARATGKSRATVDVLGFRAGGSRLVAPGGTIAKACAPRRLSVAVAFKSVRRGALMLRRWRFNGKLVKAVSAPWEFGSKRRVMRFQIVNPETLPEGRYQIAVKVTGTRWRVATVRLAC